MARVLYDGLVEYEDGTPATTSQMAKDVVTFLSWASEPEHDLRKKMGLQSTIILSALFGLSIYSTPFSSLSLQQCADPRPCAQSNGQSGRASSRGGSSTTRRSIDGFREDFGVDPAALYGCATSAVARPASLRGRQCNASSRATIMLVDQSVRASASA